MGQNVRQVLLCIRSARPRCARRTSMVVMAKTRVTSFSFPISHTEVMQLCPRDPWYRTPNQTCIRHKWSNLPTKTLRYHIVQNLYSRTKCQWCLDNLQKLNADIFSFFCPIVFENPVAFRRNNTININSIAFLRTGGQVASIRFHGIRKGTPAC